jgi:hypothetical protein
MLPDGTATSRKISTEKPLTLTGKTITPLDDNVALCKFPIYEMRKKDIFQMLFNDRYCLLKYWKERMPDERRD